MGKDYKTLKAETWIYYRYWMKEKTYSPALKQNIKVTRKGWDYLFQSKSSKQRNIRDKISRMQLLKASKFILNNTKVYKTSQEKGEKYFILENLYKNKKSKMKVIVIVKQDILTKEFYFFSVIKI